MKGNVIVMIILAFLLIFCGCNKDGGGFTWYVVKAGGDNCARFPDLQCGSDCLDFWFQTHPSWQFTEDGVPVVGLFMEWDKEYTWIPMDTVDLNNSIYYCRLSRNGDDYVVNLNNKEARVKAPPDKWASYVCFPYAGNGVSKILGFSDGRHRKASLRLGYKCGNAVFPLDQDWHVGIKINK